MKISIILSILILLSLNLSGEIFGDYEPSARARAMGGTYCSVSDEADAVFYNPAGLVLSKNHLQLAYTKRFGNEFETLNNVSMTVPISRKIGSLGIGLQSWSVNYQDVSLIAEKTYSLAHSITLMKDVHSELYFGYTAKLFHLSINTFGDQAAFGIDLGLLAILHKRTRLGFSITNLNTPKVGKDNLHELPKKLNAGISYIPYPDVITTFELQKTAGDDETEESGTEIHTGIELKVLKQFAIRFGVRNKPTSYSMGARFDIFNVIIDYAFNTHIIGNTHHFSIGYKY